MTTLHHPATRPLNGWSVVGALAPRRGLGRRLQHLLFVLLATTGLSGPVVAQEAALGANLQGLLAHARAQSPELRAMQAEAASRFSSRLPHRGSDCISVYLVSPTFDGRRLGDASVP